MGDTLFVDLRPMALLVAIGLILVVGLYQLIVYLNSQHHGRRHTGALGCICITIALVALGPDVSEALRDWTGWNNVGWYLGYVMGALGCYYFAQIAIITDLHQYGPIIHRLVKGYLVALLPLLTVIYWTQMVSMPESPAHTPRNQWELLFSVSYFVYCFGITVAVALTVGQGVAREHNPAQRLRLWLSIFGNLTAMLCFVGKLIYLTLYFVYADLLWIDQLAMLALPVTGLWFCLSVAPGWFLRLLVSLNPVVYVRQLWMLFWISKIAAKVYALMPRLQERHAYIYEQLNSVQLCIYQTLIAILDGQRELAGCLQMEPERRQKVAGIAWSNQQHQQAIALDRMLQRLKHLESPDYITIVRETIRMSQQISRT